MLYTESGKGKKRQFWGDYDEILVGETEETTENATNAELTAKEPAKKRTKGDEGAENVRVVNGILKYAPHSCLSSLTCRLVKKLPSVTKTRLRISRRPSSAGTRTWWSQQ
eukprot:gb/GECG01000995.1/.p1 GENE.gb/GECG01000995.1/~~gb/GECG01000995.1/.p1  ORF type:complete len:110 (+),score=20.93 gb/GECG01000995.1/:1-330(+)